MNPVLQSNAAIAVILMLLLIHVLAIVVACMFCFGIVSRRRTSPPGSDSSRRVSTVSAHTIFPHRPACWLAVRGSSSERVQEALGLSHSAPCSWSEGMTGEHEFFISPRVNGWVIVTGVAIPTPNDDIDECFHFLMSLSRKLGHVQFFYAEKFLQHHAWARLDDGCVTRAYAWIGETVWNQGARTIPETELDVKCVAYGEPCSSGVAAWNTEKVSQLAARWNFDPAAVDERLLNHAVGVSGELPKIY
jgi:hypothetical protein